MPLIVFCGIPQSGKTTTALQLKDYLESQGREVFLVNEEALSINKAEAYASSFTEKNTRAVLKSTVERELSPSKIIILDSLNYIKGYRYELHCLVKTVKTTHCVVYFEIPLETALIRNQTYSSDLLRDLASRMEVPRERNRWDSPLRVVRENQQVDFEDILNCLLTNRQLPEPTATKGPSVVGPDYVYQIDKITQDTIDFILNAQELYSEGAEIPVPDSTFMYPFFKKLSSLQLRKARKEFLQMNKHQPTHVENAKETFLEYIRTALLS